MKDNKSYLDYPADTIEAQELIHKHLNVDEYIKNLTNPTNKEPKQAREKI